MDISPGYTASLEVDVKPVLIPSRPLTNNVASSAPTPNNESSQSSQRIRDLGVPLENYIALGAIPSSDPVGQHVCATTWTEVLDTDFFSGYLSGPLLNTILKLYHANWIRVTYIAAASDMVIFRFYLLPDDVAQATVARDSKALRILLPDLASRCSISPLFWNAQGSHLAPRFDPWASGIDKSLYWMFNTLPSPDPSAEGIPDRYSCASLNELLDAAPNVPGLKAKLYPYQARSVALMIQKETSPHTHLDPRFENRVGADGRAFFYSPRDSMFRREAPQYETVRGGILAESMGLGKTIMVIALILATRHHLPRIPPARLPGPKIRNTVGSLFQMAAATANRVGIPVKAHFRWIPKYQDLAMETVIEMIDSERAVYEIPSLPRRSIRRNPVIPPPRQLALCGTTIVVVPGNLLQQWRSEFEKHNINEGVDSLNILVMEDSTKLLPSAEKLMTYDVILFSKLRFEAEITDGKDSHGRNSTNVRAGCQCPYIGASRVRDCSCFNPDDIYCSPLKQLHFLRIVVDEGHEFSSKATNAVRVATNLVTAERRWVVSGTPAKEKLFGVDVELASNVEVEDLAHLITEREDGVAYSAAETQSKIAAALERRKRYLKTEEEKGAARSVGILAANFLKVEPWCGMGHSDKVDWEDYAFRHESRNKRTHSAFSRCMDATLRTLVVKTRPEDVSRDITLPPLDHKVKFLEPSFYDTLTINLFILVITANSVTSEREGADYMFHPKAVTERHSLIKNLRRSAFFWTGWSKEDVQGAIDHGERYLQKEGTKAGTKDRAMLQGCLDFAKLVLKCRSWDALSLTHELGIFVDAWPEGAKTWSLNNEERPSMIGVTQLRSAQQFINDQLFDENPTEGFEALGVAELATSIAYGEEERSKKANNQTDDHVIKSGVPTSGFQEYIRPTSKVSPRKKGAKSPRKTGGDKVDQSASTDVAAESSATGVASRNKAKASTEPTSGDAKPASSLSVAQASLLKPTKRKRSFSLNQRDLPSDSPLAKPSIIGTVSSKVSYLLSRIMALQQDEKILIFYDTDNIAWYIAQCLELVHIKHLIYARHLRSFKRSEYITKFDTDDTVRVLLMDLAHGAWGLNINKASRVFFVNPPFKPHTEAQAIKRAHRIGQTRPVFVETLILRGTVEEAIYERSRAMTREEHDRAGKEISDDKGVAEIIQKAKRLDVKIEDGIGWGQMAPLETPLQIFGRSGRGDMKIEGIDREADSKSGKEAKKRKKQKNTTP